MNKKILTLSLGFLVSIGLLFLGAHLYIKHKDEKLKEQAYNSFNEFFKNQEKYIDTEYSDKKIKYCISDYPEKKPELTSIDTILGLSNFNDRMTEWKEKFSGIFKFYKIDDKYDGWELFVAERNGYGTMILYNIYPSYVGYLRQEYSYMYNWLPSVEKCVNESYEFWINNPKSYYSKYYQNGNKRLVYDLIYSVGNDYYDWYGKDKIQPVRNGKIDLAGYLTNGYNKTFINVTQYTTYEIERKDDVIEKEKNNILLIGGIILSLIFLSLLTLLSIKRSKIEKEMNLSLYDKLKNSCNPANFMNPYDEIKVEKANAIYEQLLSVNDNDIEKLKELRNQAINELNISFINKNQIEELKTKCNPQNFLNPYDAEKVRVSNLLYNRLINENISIDEFENIEKEIKEKL